jgi:Flp pilus assembly pilin Flp
MRRARSQTVIEYGLLLATVAVLVLLGGSAFGELIRRWLDGLIRGITSHT